jgi:hypothetical protein
MPLRVISEAWGLVGHAPNRTRKCATTVGSLGNEPTGRARYYAGGFLIMADSACHDHTTAGAAEPEPALTVSPYPCAS